MPVIQFDGGQLTREKKAELVEKLTQTTKNVLNAPEQHITVIIRENSTDNIGTHGKLLTDFLKEMQQ